MELIRRHTVTFVEMANLIKRTARALRITALRANNRKIYMLGIKMDLSKNMQNFVTLPAYIRILIK